MRGRLAAPNPTAQSELAAALHRVALRLGELGTREGDALASVKEAVEIRRQLAEADDRRLPELASSLHLLGLLLGFDEISAARRAVSQAVAIRRELVEVDRAHQGALEDAEHLLGALRRRNAAAVTMAWVRAPYSAAA